MSGEPPNKKRKQGEDYQDDFQSYLEQQIGRRVGEPIVKGNVKPVREGWRKAQVTMDDTTRYIPRGFMETAQGYDEFIHTAADMSQHQYNASLGKTESTQIGDYTRAMYTESTNNPYYALWVNEESQHAFIVYKGTNKEIEWFNQNIDVFTGDMKKNSYFKDAYNYYKEVAEELGPGYTLDVTGHSLGGSKAMYVTARAEEDVAAGVLRSAPHSISFNPGVGPWTNDFPSRERNLVVRNADDPASLFRPDTANTITYENYDTFDAVYNFKNKINQHGIKGFTSENAAYDGGSFVESAVGAGLPNKPRPGFDAPVRVGEEVGEEIGEIGARVGGMGAAKGIAIGAEIGMEMMMLPLQLLDVMTGGQQLDELKNWVTDSVTWAESGWGDIAGVNHYDEPMYDSAFEWMYPERQKATAAQKVREQTRDFYNATLPYSPNLFGDRSEYDAYLKQRTLNIYSAMKESIGIEREGVTPTPEWITNFNVVTRAYKRQQDLDQQHYDKWGAAHPHDINGHLSESFLGTNISTQEMGILLAQQYQILRAANGVSHNPGVTTLFDQDGLKAVMSAVARDKAIKDFYADPKHEFWTGKNEQDFDRIRDIPSYEGAYQGVVDKQRQKYIDEHPRIASGLFNDALLPPELKHPELYPPPEEINSASDDKEDMPAFRLPYDDDDRYHAVPDADPAKPLAPGNGGQAGNTPAPIVPPRSEDNLHTGQAGHHDPPHVKTDGERGTQGDTHEGVEPPDYDGPQQPYMNHDPNNPIHEPSESMSQQSYSQAINRFKNNSFDASSMHSKGMNFTRFAEMSDVNGAMAEYARDMLAD